MGNQTVTPVLADDVFVARDGTRLPLRHWDAAGGPPPIVVTPNRMRGYFNSFDGPGKSWAADGITTFAYDQRGFGRGANPGLWPGSEALRTDLEDCVAAARGGVP